MYYTWGLSTLALVSTLSARFGPRPSMKLCARHTKLLRPLAPHEYV